MLHFVENSKNYDAGSIETVYPFQEPYNWHGSQMVVDYSARWSLKTMALLQHSSRCAHSTIADPLRPSLSLLSPFATEGEAPAFPAHSMGPPPYCGVDGSNDDEDSDE